MANLEVPSADTVTDLWNTVERRLERVRRASTPGKVHKARVAIRRFRTALDGDAKPIRALRKDLKAAFKALSPVRDADVLLGHLENMENDRAALEPLTRRIRKSRKRSWTAARKKLDRLAKRHPHKRTRRQLITMSPADEVPGSDGLAACLTDLLAFEPRLRSITDGEAFHEARIAVKHLRYTLEHAGAGDDAPDELVATLAALQSVLGELHDQDVLIETLAQEVERQASKRNPDADGLAGLRRILENARRRRSGLCTRAVTDWSAAIDGGLPDAVLALAQTATGSSAREWDAPDGLAR